MLIEASPPRAGHGHGLLSICSFAVNSITLETLMGKHVATLLRADPDNGTTHSAVVGICS